MINGERPYHKTRRRQDEWRALFERYRCSGLGVSAFCRQEKISSSSFYYWRHTLGDGLTESSPSEFPHSSQNAPGFIDLGGFSQVGASTQLNIRLELGGGVVLHLVRR